MLKVKSLIGNILYKSTINTPISEISEQAINDYERIVNKVKGYDSLYKKGLSNLKSYKDELYRKNVCSELDHFDKTPYIIEHGLSVIKNIIEKAKTTNDSELIQKAIKRKTDIEKLSNEILQKGLYEDPLFRGLDVLGFKQKTSVISWMTLMQTALSPAVRPVHKRLIEYMAGFSRPQSNKYSRGYYFERKDGEPLSKKETKQIVPRLTEFINQCGVKKDHIQGDFEQFIREWTFNTLTYDHPPVEIIWSEADTLYGFRNLDAKTIRVADTYFPDPEGEETFGREYQDGELPVYVQVFNEMTQAEFYNKEMWLAKRNPIAAVEAKGYGRSEIEDIIIIISAIMNAIKYNSNQFIDGVPTSSFIWLKDATRTSLNEFHRHLQSYRQNINSSTTIAIGTSEEPKVIKTRDSNKDMEFGNLLSYLISIVCSVYNLIPEAVGLKSPLSANVQYESGMDERVKHVLNEAVVPLLTKFESGINEKIMPFLEGGEYVFKFGGLGENQNEEQKRLIEKSKVVPINSILKELGQPKTNLPDTWILSSEYIQSIQLLFQLNSGQTDNTGQEKPQIANAKDIEKSIIEYFEL